MADANMTNAAIGKNATISGYGTVDAAGTDATCLNYANTKIATYEVCIQDMGGFIGGVDSNIEICSKGAGESTCPGKYVFISS